MAFTYSIKVQGAIYFVPFTVHQWVDIFSRPKYRDIVFESLLRIKNPRILVRNCKFRTVDFMEQKLNYIHMNSCVCKPPLAKNPIEYLHSSANFYLGGSHIIYPVEHVMNMKDINFEKR